MSDSLEEALRRIDALDKREILQPFWDESQALLPQGPIPLLEPEKIHDNCQWGGLPAEAEALAQETARRVRRSPELTALIWHCRRLLLEHADDYERQSIQDWPIPRDILGTDCAPLFYGLVALEAVPRILSFHRARGLPEDVTRATCRWVRRNMEIHRTFNEGRWGVNIRSLYWSRHHVQGELYQIGRFEFMVGPFRRGPVVFRNTETGETLALAEDGTRLTKEGFVERPDEKTAEGWTARLAEEEGALVGAPISPFGRALRTEVRLPRGAWRRVLAPGDPILDLHIPAGGGMSPEVCRDSILRAVTFFNRYFPDRPFRALACWSWIFSPDLEEFLPPESNLMRFERETYLFPVASPPVSGLVFIFGDPKIDPRNAPRDTRLRSALLDHLERGGQLRLGGMFMLNEDLERFGSQPYSSRRPL
jgi:hypothetical protein